MRIRSSERNVHIIYTAVKIKRDQGGPCSVLRVLFFFNKIGKTAVFLVFRTDL